MWAICLRDCRRLLRRSKDFGRGGQWRNKETHFQYHLWVDIEEFPLVMVIITRCDTIIIPNLLQTQALICWPGPVPLCGSRSPARAHHELNANNFLIRRLIYIHRIKSNFMWQTIFHCDTSVYYPCTPPPANTSHKQYHMDKIWKHNYYGHFVKRWLFPLILSICSARNCNKNLIV